MLAQQLFSPAFELIDLSQIADEDLKQKAWSGMMELSLKHVDERDLLPFIQDVVTLLQEIEKAGGIDYIKTIFYYLLMLRSQGKNWYPKQNSQPVGGFSNG